MDASVPFGMRWAAASCQDATAIITSHLNKIAHILNYIDNFGGVASSKASAQVHFNQLQATLEDIGLVEAKHTASPPSKHMTWLGLELDSVLMAITITPTKLTEIANLVTKRQAQSHADLRNLRVLQGK